LIAEFSGRRNDLKNEGDFVMDEVQQERVASSGSMMAKAFENLAAVADYKRSMAKVVVVFAVLGGVAACLYGDHYKSMTSITTPSDIPSLASLIQAQSGAAGALMAAAGGGVSLKDPNAQYLGMLESRTVVDAQIKHFNLMQVYHAKDMTAARMKLGRNTTIKVDKNSLITITVKDRNPQRAADLANGYVDELRALTKALSVDAAVRQRKFYEEQIQQEQVALIHAEVAVKNLQAEKGVLDPGSQMSVVLASSAKAHADIAAKKIEIESLKSFSTEANPAIQQAEKELAAMQAESAKISQHGTTSEFGDFGLKDVPEAGLAFLRAERDLAFHQILYATLLKQYEAARLDEANDGSAISQVEVAVAADRKAQPTPLLLFVLFVMLGAVAAWGWAQMKIWLAIEMKKEEVSAGLSRLKGALGKG